MKSLHTQAKRAHTTRAYIVRVVVQRVDNAIHRINRYPLDKCQQNKLRYPLDSDLSGR